MVGEEGIIEAREGTRTEVEVGKDGLEDLFAQGKIDSLNKT